MKRKICLQEFKEIYREREMLHWTKAWQISILIGRSQSRWIGKHRGTCYLIKKKCSKVIGVCRSAGGKKNCGHLQVEQIPAKIAFNERTWLAKNFRGLCDEKFL